MGKIQKENMGEFENITKFSLVNFFDILKIDLNLSSNQSKLTASESNNLEDNF